MELRRAAGNLLVVGLAWKELSAMERAWLKLIRPAGIILYKRNIADAAQTRSLLKESVAFCAPHAVRCVDVEGGTVNRLNEALAVIPSAQAVARAMLHPTLLQKTQKDGARDVEAGGDPTLLQKTQKDGARDAEDEGYPTLLQKTQKDGARDAEARDVEAGRHPTLLQKTQKDGARDVEAGGYPTLLQKTQKDGARDAEARDVEARKVEARKVENRLAREHGELIARAVAAFGFNTSLAPMIDLALPDSVEVLGTRCAAREPADVIAYAREFLKGFKSRGIVGCGKHFPGLGGGTRDSHLETPAIRRDGADIWRDDLEPYRALRDELPMVMINHAAYPNTPGRQRPASVSSYWIQTVLRKRIGYRGIVLSDDLEMGGILKFMSIEEAAIEAIRTGSDLIEICHHAEPIVQAFEALISEGERSAAFRKLLLERGRVTERKRAGVFSDKVQPALGARQFEALRTRILRFGETIAAAQPAEAGTA